MKRREAFTPKGGFRVVSSNRMSVDGWYENYTEEQIIYLSRGGYLEACIPYKTLDGDINKQYFCFTKKGMRLKFYYECGSVLKWLYYMTIPRIEWFWRRLRIKCGHRYPWQGYEDVSNLDEI